MHEDRGLLQGNEGDELIERDRLVARSDCDERRQGSGRSPYCPLSSSMMLASTQ